jgi:hypothetical protein
LELPKRTNPVSELESRAVLNWCQFLSATTDEELEELSMTDSNIARANQALEDLSEDPKARRLAQDREMWHFLYDREMYLERKAGEEMGEAKGRAEGLITAVRTACELLGVELTPAREARLAGASAGELEELLDSLKRHRRWAD